ncbi:MAG: hypothetical protein K8R57_03820 [Verrucomicrobia bacterium]|nr:hypothetical protein [Verrucomicrobiota bacterium]
MNITNISSVALRNLIKLTERKESLIKQIESIEGQLTSLISGKPVRAIGKRRGRPAKKGPKAAGKKISGTAKRAPRGAIKKKILAALKAAGDAGMKVTDLSKKIGVKNANVHVWFSSTGSKLPEIKKVGKAHYRIQEKKA